MAFASGSAFSAVKPSLASAFRPSLIQSSAFSCSAMSGSGCKPYTSVLTAGRPAPISPYTTVWASLPGSFTMRDLLLQCAGVLTIAVALIHGILGETKVFARARIEPERLRTLIRLVWQASTVAWIGGGVLLIAAPWMQSEPARHWIVVA